MAAHLILAVAGLTSVWAMLSVIGGERERVLQNVEALRRAKRVDAPPSTTAPAAATAENPTK